MNERETGDDPTDARAIRASFATFCGSEHYDKFVRELNTFGAREGRMRYWQEVLWDGFAATNTQLALTFAQLQTMFRICAIHDRDLAISSKADVERSLEYDAALASAGAAGSTQFIHAAGAWSCQDCWLAFREWESRHPLTLATLFAQGEVFSKARIAVAEIDGSTSDEWLLFSDRVRVGDELWRFRSPEERWVGRCGREYVVLVRRGRVVSMELTALN